MFGALIPIVMRHKALAGVGAFALILTALLGVQTARIGSLKRSHAEYVAKAEKARADAVAAVLARERAAQAISQQSEQAHEQTIADLRAAAARRLQAYTGKPTSVPVVPRAAFRINEKACGDGLSIPVASAVALMLAADENTQQLIALQSWLRAQQESWK